MAETLPEDPRAERLAEEDSQVIGVFKANNEWIYLMNGMSGYEIPLSKFKSREEAGYDWNQRIRRLEEHYPRHIFVLEEYPARNPGDETKFLQVIP